VLETKIGKDFHYAAQLLEKGELVAIPTETVYGLAANGFDPIAVAKIFEAKKRPLSNPLILHFSDFESIRGHIKNIPKQAEKLAQKFWPGAMTLLLDVTNHIPDIVNSGQSRIAVRIPNHDLTLNLLRRLKFPLAAPSANLYGRVSPTQAEHVKQQLAGRIPYILDGGDCNTGIESTIIGFEGDNVVIYRLGGISIEDIEACLAIKVKIHDHKGMDKKPEASGMVKYHYAPQTPIHSIDDIILFPEIEKSGFIGFNELISQLPAENQFLLSPNKDLEEASQNLYRALHYMDDKKFERLFICQFPSIDLGKSINDRINKAIEKYKK